MLTDDARCLKEIKRRIILAKSAFTKLENILKNVNMSMTTRMRVLNCYVYPVLMYGSEAWSLTSECARYLESCEVWFLRRMLRISWTDRVTNEEVFRRANVKRKVLKEMRIRQLKFLGHMVRKDGLENLALTGKIAGKRSRGRRRVMWMSSLDEWLAVNGVKQQGVHLLKKARSRKLWQNMIANVRRYGT